MPLSGTARALSVALDRCCEAIDEGKKAQKIYDEFAKWCEEASKDLQFAIKTGKGNKADLEATIQKESASSDASKAKIDNAGSALRNEKINCH